MECGCLTALCNICNININNSNIYLLASVILISEAILLQCSIGRH